MRCRVCEALLNEMVDRLSLPALAPEEKAKIPSKISCHPLSSSSLLRRLLSAAVKRPPAAVELLVNPLKERVRAARCAKFADDVGDAHFALGVVWTVSIVVELNHVLVIRTGQPCKDCRGKGLLDSGVRRD